MPALVVHAEEERFWSLAHAERLVARLGSARLVRTPGAGHTCQLEVPEVVNPILRGFLDDVHAA